MWNGRKPARRPAGIVRAEDGDDVAVAVRLAKARGESASVLAPALDAAVTPLPTPRSHVNWMNLAGAPELPDMALSLLGDTLVEVVAVWDDPSQDAQMQAWVTDHTRQLEPVSIGSQIGADCMASRGLGPDAYFSAGALARLKTLRDRWDPDRRFVSFLLSTDTT